MVLYLGNAKRTVIANFFQYLRKIELSNAIEAWLFRCLGMWPFNVCYCTFISMLLSTVCMCFRTMG